MVRTADAGLVKEINLSIVLNVLRRTSPTSRAGIAEVTGLNKATVSSLVAMLIEKRYAVEVGLSKARVQGRRGRRARLLVFNGQAATVIGAELDVHNVQLLVTDLQGRAAWRDTQPLPLTEPFADTYPRIVAALRKAIQHAPTTPHGVVGITLGVPCMVDTAAGVVLEGVNVGWKDVPLASMLTQSLGLPVSVHNSSSLSALGELRFGAARGLQNVIYLHSFHGLGGGLIMGGTLYGGTRGYAGELGHMVVEPNGLRCSCGSRGCWELYASELALRRRLLDGPGRWAGRLEITVDEVVAAAEQGDVAAVAALEEIGHYLGLGVSSLVNALNPEVVVLGGSISRAGQWVMQPAERVLHIRSLAPLAACVRLVPGALDQDAAVLGAVSVALDSLFPAPQLMVARFS
jgi:predicted NBD/HSP70 family sugar kinase